MSDRRTIIIGLDGVPFGLLNDLAGKGVMKNTREIISRGVFKKMQSSLPEVSSVAWSSIITGANPAEHGIFGFTDLFPNTYNLRFPDFNNLRIPPFWTEIPGKSIIINVPSTYPVREMNGAHISGFVSIDFEKSVYPPSLIVKLQELDYRLDVDSEKAHESMESFLSDLDRTLKARIQAYRYLWDTQNWQLFMLVFTGTDRLMHFLWDAYEDENHKYHRDLLTHFQKIDDAIGEISVNLREDDLLFMLSDHGFEKLDKDVYISYLLRKEGFLRFRDDNDPTLGNIDYSTKAFALDPARIYTNLKNQYPCGGVHKKEKEAILRDLECLFKSLEIEGNKVIRHTYRKEEIYSGPLLEQAPDLVLVANQGFNLKANIKTDKLEDKPIFTGKHIRESAFLLLDGSVDKGLIPENPTVYDVRGIVQQKHV